MTSCPESLEIRDLTVTYPNGRRALETVGFNIPAGAVTVVIGESGSGKSTVAKALLGMLPLGTVTTGEAFLGERSVLTAGAHQRRLRGRVLGYVPQDPVTNLDPLQKVGRAVKEAIAVTESSFNHLELLRSVGFPDPATIAACYPHQLSGGQRQRVLISLGLAGSPQVIIGDEPTSALDVTVQREVLDLLCDRAAAESRSLLLITHDIAIATERADHIVVLRNGRVLETGPPSRIGRHPYTQELFAAADLIPVCRKPEPTGPILLRGENLTKNFGRGRSRVRALDEVSFSLREGETLGVVGRSGSGKTTLSRSVLRLLELDHGLLEADGSDVLSRRGRALRAYRRRVQPVFQNPYASLDPTYSVQDTIAEAIRLSGDAAPGCEARVAELLADVGLESSTAGRMPRELSGGQQQRVAIARALAFSPQVIVLDEAVSALDTVVRQKILALLTSLQRDRGLSYLFVSHDLSVVRQVCDRVVVIHEGRIVEEGPTRDVFSRPEHEHTQELIAAVPRGRHHTKEYPE